MSKLAETYLHLDINLDESSKNKLKNFLRARAPIYSEGVFNQELEFAVYVEDGSVKIWLAAAGILYAGISGYGSFRTGIDYLVKDAQTISERLFEDVKEVGVSDQQVINFQRRLGVPGQIKRVLRDIKKLEREGNDRNQGDYNTKIALISRSLERIAKQLDHPEDLQLFRENVPQQFRTEVPKRLPNREVERARLIALRPEEFETDTFDEIGTSSLQIGADQHDNMWASPDYEIKQTADGIRLFLRGT